MTDKELMKLAKERVFLKSLFKWLCTLFFVINVFLIFIWFFLTDGGYFWPGWILAGSGLALTIIAFVFNFVLSVPDDKKVMDEYNKLKDKMVNSRMP
ncbi:MAG: 2TM domain-containing protein [Lentimicrobiaceae bacterium]|nr:2TM domain-containing protein [Lentimicrobiaceae bacterium]